MHVREVRVCVERARVRVVRDLERVRVRVVRVRVVRGGAWYYREILTRCAYRLPHQAHLVNISGGFRLAHSLPTATSK